MPDLIDVFIAGLAGSIGLASIFEYFEMSNIIKQTRQIEQLSPMVVQKLGKLNFNVQISTKIERITIQPYKSNQQIKLIPCDEPIQNTDGNKKYGKFIEYTSESLGRVVFPATSKIPPNFKLEINKTLISSDIIQRQYNPIKGDIFKLSPHQPVTVVGIIRYDPKNHQYNVYACSLSKDSEFPIKKMEQQKKFVCYYGLVAVLIGGLVLRLKHLAELNQTV